MWGFLKKEWGKKIGSKRGEHKVFVIHEVDNMKGTKWVTQRIIRSRFQEPIETIKPRYRINHNNKDNNDK